MQLIQNRNNQCAQACIAMLAGKTLNDVEKDMGGPIPNLAFPRTLQQLAVYGVTVTVHRDSNGEIEFDRHRVTPYSSVSETATLLCRVIVFQATPSGLWEREGHLVIIDGGQLYDPSLDRVYPWKEGLQFWNTTDMCIFFSTVFEVS